ncbi:MAG: hypothetical protein HY841_07030 [Bacteroidetes bacterium]|nr:hypothetical protein [Bacteroidota bacterium]
MSNKSLEQEIDDLYQTGISLFAQWKEKALAAIHPEYSSQPSSIPSPPQSITNFEWTADKKYIMDLYDVFVKLKFITSKEVDFQTNFFPRFYKSIPAFSQIKCKQSTKNLIWVFDTLLDCRAISGKNDLRIFLPLHFISKNGKPLKPNCIKQELYEIRKLKKAEQYPDFVLTIKEIFNKKSLLKS